MNYAYFFAGLNGKMMWSGETKESLLRRFSDKSDCDAVKKWLDNRPEGGEFLLLDYGAVVCTRNERSDILLKIEGYACEQDNALVYDVCRDIVSLVDGCEQQTTPQAAKETP